ncbi:hypothetical protein CEH05_19760 [Halobacillus halophilus]|uniref:hypothetical protein n=1 Tax=Halobacillus halophilus TaxID=1570 RepID=UPI0002E43089|nr:hypothetical protein [Halobacillus halophilus]ASF41280.1 hypothetical protein CEH05_19760 [Halobacillus halophilus]
MEKFEKISSYFTIPISILIFVVSSYAFRDYSEIISILVIIINLIIVVILIAGMYLQRRFKSAIIFSILLAGPVYILDNAMSSS